MNDHPAKKYFLVKASSWGRRNNNQYYVDLGFANPILILDLVAGVYDIWIEEPPNNPNGIKLPIHRDKQIINFQPNDRPLIISIPY